MYPLGQQWTPSEQQTAFGNGQQPHWPDDNLQHVFPSGHSDWPSGQTTDFNLIAMLLVEAMITSLPLLHVPKMV